MRIFRIIAVSLLSLAACHSSSQTPEIILDSLAKGRKPEKAFTHFDKSFYLPGETIWFKTYLIVDGRPGTSSTVAKAELIDRQGRIIASQLMPVAIGSASGSLVLPGNLAYGTYVFRLYTQQMLRSGADNFYYKAIPVVSSESDLTRPEGKDVDIRFFAESGTFLADELNILAFTAVDEHGKPANVNGTIRDRAGSVMSPFNTMQNGMGKIELTPKKGERYTAEYTLPSGEKKTVELPAVANEGTNLLIVDEVLKKRLIVNTRASLNPTNKASYIIGEMDQTLIFKIDISKSGGRYMGRVPVNELPGGLLHIAVFNESHDVLAERNCYVNSKQELVQPVLNGLSTSAGKRTENNYEFSLPDSLEGTMSVSVIDLSQAPSVLQPDNIITAALYTSSLRATGLNPLYDLQPLPGMEINEHIDLLLLTHEYKWDWKSMTKLAAVPYPFQQENYIHLRAAALADRNNKPPLQNAELAFILQTADSAVNSFVATTNDQGIVEVDGLFYEDTATIYVRNNAEKNRDKRLLLEPKSAPLTEQYNYPVELSFINASIPLLYRQNIQAKPLTARVPDIDVDTSVVVLEELVVQSKAMSKTELVENQYTKGMFASGARTSIDLINYPPANQTGNVFDYLKGRYSYMQVLGNFPNYSLVYRAMKSLGAQSFIPMNLYLDEFPADASMITTIPMRDIALIRIYSSGFMGTGGALAVYTKKGDDSKSNKLFDNMTKLKLPGFSKTRVFYSPDYHSKSLNVKSDNRRTIFWNPAFTYIPEDGRVPFSFFTNDSRRGYKIIMQGFTINGKLLYLEKTVK